MGFGRSLGSEKNYWSIFEIFGEYYVLVDRKNTNKQVKNQAKSGIKQSLFLFITRNRKTISITPCDTKISIKINT